VTVCLFIICNAWHKVVRQSWLSSGSRLGKYPTEVSDLRIIDSHLQEFFPLNFQNNFFTERTHLLSLMPLNERTNFNLNLQQNIIVRHPSRNKNVKYCKLNPARNKNVKYYKLKPWINFLQIAWWTGLDPWTFYPRDNIWARYCFFFLSLYLNVIKHRHYGIKWCRGQS
jgi:hypothetical protein